MCTIRLTGGNDIHIINLRARCANFRVKMYQCIIWGCNYCPLVKVFVFQRNLIRGSNDSMSYHNSLALPLSRLSTVCTMSTCMCLEADSPNEID